MQNNSAGSNETREFLPVTGPRPTSSEPGRFFVWKEKSHFGKIFRLYFYHNLVRSAFTTRTAEQNLVFFCLQKQPEEEEEAAVSITTSSGAKL